MRSRQELNETLALESDTTQISAASSSSRVNEINDRLLTDRDVCSITGLDRVTLYRLRNAGKIGFYKFGRVIRYSAEHIREFLKRHERQPRPRGSRSSR